MSIYEHKVQYYETDQMGIVHHSNYIRWFEEARTDLMDQLGFGYEKMEEIGIIIPVLSAEALYKTMTHFADVVQIEAKITEYNGIRLALSYVVSDKKTGVVRCTGKTSHCFLNKAGKPLSLKRSFPELHNMFDQALNKQPGDDLSTNVKNL